MYLDGRAGKTQCQCCKKKCSGEVLRVQDKYFHIGCFQCKVCHNSLAQGGFFCKDGDYFCTKDYQDLYGTKCSSCSRFVEGEVVTALGKTYHSTCFTCARCRSLLHHLLIISIQFIHLIYSQSIVSSSLIGFIRTFHCNLSEHLEEIWIAISKKYELNLGCWWWRF